MSKLDPRIEAIREKYDLAASDFWELPQKKGTWIAKHSALEIVAVKANIIWSMPQILEAKGEQGISAMVVAGTLDKRTEWATGEASPKNNKNAYPWAMAEKRAKDRVVLKLSGIAGLVYSEDEADDFKEPEKAAPEPPQPITYASYLSSITNSQDEQTLKSVFAVLWRDNGLSKDEKGGLKTAYEARKTQLSVDDGYVPPTFNDTME